MSIKQNILCADILKYVQNPLRESLISLLKCWIFSSDNFLSSACKINDVNVKSYDVLCYEI